MFAGEHKLDNLILIVDNNKVCMLDYCKKILDLAPLRDKFKVFKWDVKEIAGHDIKQLYTSLKAFKGSAKGRPKVLIANTIKGKGVSFVENKVEWHGIAPKKDEYERAVLELDEALKKLNVSRS